MKEYIKPFIEDEDIEIEDICTVSGGTRVGNLDEDGQEDSIDNLWP